MRLIKHLPLAPKHTLPQLVLAVLLLAVFLLPAELKSLLTFERELILAGEWWRLLSGQLVHWSFAHLALNMAGLVVTWLFFAEYISSFKYALVVFVIALSSNLGMFLFAPQIALYVGFSGTVYGLCAWGSVQDIQQKVPFGWLLFIAVCGKVTYDMFFGAISVTGESADNLAVAAHFFGVLAGLLIALVTGKRQTEV